MISADVLEADATIIATLAESVRGSSGRLLAIPMI
jgi:hypothetical protein